MVATIATIGADMAMRAMMADSTLPRSGRNGMSMGDCMSENPRRCSAWSVVARRENGGRRLGHAPAAIAGEAQRR